MKVHLLTDFFLELGVFWYSGDAARKESVDVWKAPNHQRGTHQYYEKGFHLFIIIFYYLFILFIKK
jgi:hypothetical protein